jgi:hypothetical protein
MLDTELEALIVQLALDNPRLGYKKLVSELRKLGCRVGRSTVHRLFHRGNGLAANPLFFILH